VSRSPGIKQRRGDLQLWLLAPAIIALLCFFVYPLIYIVGRSLPDYSLKYYIEIVNTPVYLKVIGLTFETSFLVSAICFLLGYPYALAMSHARGMTFVLLSIALLLPFWVSFLLRSFAWMILLQDTGPINQTLIRLGMISSPLPLIRNTVGVTIGMAHILLPYVVLPIYSVMRRIDYRLIEAASICGARPVRVFCRIYFPLTLPGVYAAMLICFTLGLGFYITPALLGGPQNTLLGELIADQIGEQLNFAAGSAIAVVLLVLTAAAFGLFGLLQLGSRQRVAQIAAMVR
jgi:ABC-type spermidine/putrescine transport system permease subunit I